MKTTLTERKLAEIGKTIPEWLALNEKLAMFSLDIYYIPKKGWRVFGFLANDVPGVCSTGTCWIGNSRLLEWFDNTQEKVEEFMKVYSE
jgi:hypothetical protein